MTNVRMTKYVQVINVCIHASSTILVQFRQNVSDKITDHRVDALRDWKEILIRDANVLNVIQITSVLVT